MSTWIYVTNLPLYYDDIALTDIFNGIGQIMTTKISKDKLILKSTAIVQFSHSKHAKLAASKKDGTVIEKSAIRVFIIWCNKEQLSTIKVSNILANSNIRDLEKYFKPFGAIVNIEIVSHDNTHELDYALISYCKVDYALQACQEMNDTIIGSDNQLSVSLVNPDARNLQWKRHAFEYIALNNKLRRKRSITVQNTKEMGEKIENNIHINIKHENENEMENDNTDEKEEEVMSSEIPLSPISNNNNNNNEFTNIHNNNISNHNIILSPTTKSIQTTPSDISSNECNDVIMYCELIVYGFLRDNMNQNEHEQISKISNITLYYFDVINTDHNSIHVLTSKPLYLVNPSIPAPPQRLPPSPPHTPPPCGNGNGAKKKKNVFSIEGKYQQIFDIYRDRLDLIENKMGVLKTELDTISSTMNRTLVGLEHRRINDINTIQKQFNSTITALCYQINNQINNQIIKITQKMEHSRNQNQERIDQLENKILLLKKENNVLRRKNKINKILKIQQKNEKNNCSNNNNMLLLTEEEKLKNWLFDTVKLPQYLSVLINNGYDDLESVNDITFAELQTIGINKMGHRKKIIKYAAKLNVLQSAHPNASNISISHAKSHQHNNNNSKYISSSAMSPNSANSSLLYTSHNIWSDDSVSSIPWNNNSYQLSHSQHSQGSNHTNNNNNTKDKIIDD